MTRWGRRQPTLAAFLILLVGCTTGAGRIPNTAGDTREDRTAISGRIDAAARGEMERWQVPGLAIGIVKDGELLFAQGFGHRDPDLELAVTPATKFGLASMTKAFTALTLGLMVEDGVIGWDTRVRDRLPDFTLSDPERSSSVTFRDLLSHRTGLSNKDELWTSGEYMSREILEHVDELEVDGPLRGSFEYNNVLYIAAAEMVEKLTGSSWDAVASRRLLGPLGMSDTGFSVEQLLRSEGYSSSFSRKNDAFVANDFPGPEHHAWYFTRGSGSMYSNVEDLARWMVFQLNEGSFGGKQLVPASIVRETHEPQMAITDPPFYLDYPEIKDQAYGMGWFLDEYRGHRRIHHGGASMGYSNYLTLFPEDRIGIVILSNRQVMMPVELTYRVSDILLGLRKRDWATRFEEYLPED